MSNHQCLVPLHSLLEEILILCVPPGAGQVMASIAGDTATTTWNPSTLASNYVATATASLLNLYDTYGLAGFDIDYEESIMREDGTTEPFWLSSWCKITVSLKQVSNSLPYFQLDT